MQTQAEPRVKRRIPCEVGGPGGRYSGMVLNLSRHGLFVQTRMPAKPGSLVAVDLREMSRDDPIPLSARVVWKRVIPANLVVVTQGGMGLRIHRARPDYGEFFADVFERSDDSSWPTAEGAGLRDFRVRVKLAGAPRSRTLVVSAATEEEAREQALSVSGEGWTILELE